MKEQGGQVKSMHKYSKERDAEVTQKRMEQQAATEYMYKNKTH